MGRLGVLLLNLGGPEQLSDVRPFLFNLFSDPEIIRIPIAALQKPLAWIISTSRAKKSQANYQKIGGGSPLRRITEEQARALETQLRAQGEDAKVYIGMRYWHPFTEEALAQIELARVHAGDNAFTHYNVGLIQLDAGEPEQALIHAHRALGLGLAREGLKEKLVGLGKWREPEPPASASNAILQPDK